MKHNLFYDFASKYNVEFSTRDFINQKPFEKNQQNKTKIYFQSNHLPRFNSGNFPGALMMPFRYYLYVLIHVSYIFLKLSELFITLVTKKLLLSVTGLLCSRILIHGHPCKLHLLNTVLISAYDVMRLAESCL